MNASVILPTRNRSALLTMALRSVLRQQDVELEVIVVDEGSSDDTPTVLAALADPRVRVIRHDAPQGLPTARNHGAAEARGAWLAFIDDDDLWAPDKLARQLRAAEDVGRDWVYAGAVNIIDCRVVSGRPPLPPEKVVEVVRRYNPIPGGGSNVVIRRPAWLRTGPFDVRLPGVEDWEMSIRLAQDGPPACVYSPLVARRLHSSNATLDIAQMVRVTRLIESFHHTPADWGRLHQWMAYSCLRAGKRRAALGHFARAAVRGQGRAAASGLGAMLNETFGRRIVGLKANDELSGTWIATANAWLQEFGIHPH